MSFFSRKTSNLFHLSTVCGCFRLSLQRTFSKRGCKGRGLIDFSKYFNKKNRLKILTPVYNPANPVIFGFYGLTRTGFHPCRLFLLPGFYTLYISSVSNSFKDVFITLSETINGILFDVLGRYDFQHHEIHQHRLRLVLPKPRHFTEPG